MAKTVKLKFGRPHTSKNSASTGGSGHVNTHRSVSNQSGGYKKNGTRSPYSGSQPVRVRNNGTVSGIKKR